MEKKKVAFVAPVKGGGPYELYRNTVQELNIRYADIECTFISGIQSWIKIHRNRDKYDIVVSSIPFLWKPFGAKLILNIHGFFNREKSFSAGGLLAVLFPYNMLFAKNIIYSSKFLQTGLGYSEKKSKVIYPFFSLGNQYKTDRVLLKNKPEIHLLTVTSFAFFDKGRGVYDIIEKLQTVETDTSIILTIIGGGKYLKKIQKESKRYMLKENIRLIFTGALPKNVLEEYYQKSNIFVYSTYQDTFGISILEAMSYGLPVILNNYALFSEIFHSIHRVEHTQDFSTILQRIIYDTSFHNTLQNIGYETCKKYSAENITAQWHEELIKI